MAVVLAISMPPAGVAIVNSIRGDDDDRRGAGRLVDDARGGEDDEDRVSPRDPRLDGHEPDADQHPALGSRPRGDATTDETGGARTAARSVAALGLTGRIAFTTADDVTDHCSRDRSPDGPTPRGDCGTDANASTAAWFYTPRDIHHLDLRSGKITAVAASPLFEQDSAWSPDGSRLAYSVARGDANATLHTIRADGTDDRQIVSVEGKLAIEPTWSPNGRTLAFTMENPYTPFGSTCCREIWMVNADGSNLRRVDEIATDGAPEYPAWSPDGRYLAFERNVPGGRETWVLDLETRRLEYLTDGGQPAWAPDGQRVAVDGPNGSLRVVDVASGDATSFISHPGRALGDPTWSPDGKWIAFVSYSTSGSNAGDHSIWIARPNGESMTPIVEGDKDYFAPSWTR